MTTITPVAEICDNDERYARAAWSIITEPGDTQAGILVQQLGYTTAITAITDSTPTQLENIAEGLAEHAKRWLPRLHSDVVERALNIADRTGIRLVNPATVPDLADLGATMPHLLWVRGDVHALSADRRILTSGARAGTSYGETVTGNLVDDLVDKGVTIHSGLAYGIDAAAHRAALNHGGHTVAWLAGGLDRTYPAGNTQLGDRIADTPGSAIVSELPCGAAPTRWRFLSRGRLQVAATRATVIVEAGYRSGALALAGNAVALGRPLGAVPGPVTSPASSGCHRLLREFGASVITSGADALELIA